MSSTARAIIRPDTLSAWKGPSLLIVSTDGECGDRKPLSGYYFREARFLKTLRLTIDGETPWLCEAAAASPSVLAFTYVYPEIAEFGGGGSGSSGDDIPINGRGIPQRALAIEVTYTVVPDGLIVDVRATNHATTPVRFELALHCDADFADIQEALGGHRQQQAPVTRETRDNGLVLRYGHERLRFVSTVHLTTSQSWTVDASRIVTTIALAPQQSESCGLRINPSDVDGSAPPLDADATGRAVADWKGRFASVSIPGNRAAETILNDNLGDFASFPLLEGRADEWLALQAGMPLYPALFGRDTLTAGWQAL